MPGKQDTATAPGSSATSRTLSPSKSQAGDVLAMLGSSKKRKTPPARAEPRRKLSRISSLQSSPVIKEGPKLGMVQNGGVKTFTEPELAAPAPLYTGLPLEEPPLAKIKKESLWPRKKKLKDETREDTPENTEAEQLYKGKLKSKSYDKLLHESVERKPVRPSRNPKAPRKPTQANAKTPRQHVTVTVRSTRSATSPKRIKVISPRKPTSGLVPSARDKGPEPPTEDDPTNENDDYCTTCGGSGIFICCETCPKSFHFTCCDPPIEDVPEDTWHCRECMAEKNHNQLRKWNHIGLFGQLLNQHETRNPAEFQLPRRIKEAFMGVFADTDGLFLDDTIKPEIPNGKRSADALDPDLYDKKGRPHLCHQCGLSGLENRALIHCDYCPLVWHLDCLVEPMCSKKTLGSKWRCPNHAEDLLPLGLYTKRQFKDSAVGDIALHNHFLQIAHANNIIIKTRNQPYLKDGVTPALQDYIHYQANDFIRPDTDFEDDGESDTYNDADIHEDFQPPAFLQSIAFPGRIAQQASSRLAKVLSLNEKSRGGHPSTAFVHRVPEETIIVSFLEKGSKQRILDQINEYEQRGHEEEEIVDTLNTLGEQNLQGLGEQNSKDLGEQKLDFGKQNKLDFSELVSVASKELTQVKQEPELSPQVLQDLYNIKRLMELKGRDKLLSFLQE